MFVVNSSLNILKELVFYSILTFKEKELCLEFSVSTKNTNASTYFYCTSISIQSLLNIQNPFSFELFLTDEENIF